MARSIGHIYLRKDAKGSLLKSSPLYLGLTWLIGKMLDIARYGPQEGKLHH
jgi:hypothetical protein